MMHRTGPNIFASDGHVIANFREDRRFHEVSLSDPLGTAQAAHDQFRVFSHAALD
jgi:hypothetical protein